MDSFIMNVGKGHMQSTLDDRVDTAWLVQGVLGVYRLSFGGIDVLADFSYCSMICGLE